MLIKKNNTPEVKPEKAAKLPEIAQEIYERFAEEYTTAFIIDYPNNHYQVLKSQGEWEEFFEGFSDDIDTVADRFVEVAVHQDDRASVREELRFNRVRTNLATEQIFEMPFRYLIGDSPVWLSMHYMSLNDECTSILLGFKNVSSQRLNDILRQCLTDDLISAYYCELDILRVTEIKHSPVFNLPPGLKSCTLDQLIDSAAALADEEYRDAWRNFLSIDGFKKSLKNQSRADFIYSSHITGTVRWVQASFFIVAADALGTPKAVCVTFSLVSNERVESIKLNQEIARREAQESAVTHLIDLVTDAYDSANSLTLLLESVGHYYGASRTYISRVSDDSQSVKMLFEWTAEGVEPRRDKKVEVSASKFSSWFDSFKKYGIYRSEAQIVSPLMIGTSIKGFIGMEGAEHESDNLRIMQVASTLAVGEIIKYRDRELNSKVTQTFASSYSSTYVANLGKGTMRAIRESDQSHIWTDNHKGYKETMHSYIRSVVSPVHTRMMLDITKPEAIRQTLRDKDRHDVWYLAKYPGRTSYTWHILSIRVFNRETSEVLMGFVEKNELIADVFDNTITGSLLAGYYCDLDADIIYEVKNSSFFQLPGGGREGQYSKVMQHVAENVFDEEFRDEILTCSSIESLRASLLKKNTADFIYSSHITGEQHWVKATYYVILREPNGKPCHLALSFSNITREQIEREKAKAEKEVANERYNFLINISHELRTPLTLIVGPLRRMLRKSPLTDKDREMVTRVCQQADRMANLLNTVLTTNKIEKGAEEVQPESTSFNEWVTAVSSDFRDEADGHNMEIRLDLDPSVGEIEMDKHLCKIVFSNLMTNAMRYNSTGSPIIVSTRSTDDGRSACVSVKDSGCGIGDVDMSRLFERYYRATEDKTGFGIGLAYSKTIIDAHGGRIGAFNNPEGVGATFWFSLPAGLKTK